MSGRVISGYRDGKPIVGFRKTERVVVRRRAPAPVPGWRLFFALPAQLGFSIADGSYPGVIGVTIFKGCVIITGRKDWVLDQAAVFLMKVARELMPIEMPARLSREEDDAAQLVHVPKRGEEDYVEIVVASGKPVVVMTGRSMRTIVRAGR